MAIRFLITYVCVWFRAFGFILIDVRFWRARLLTGVENYHRASSYLSIVCLVAIPVYQMKTLLSWIVLLGSIPDIKHPIHTPWCGPMPMLFRFNSGENCLGAGIRLGGHVIDGFVYGVDNHVSFRSLSNSLQGWYLAFFSPRFKSVDSPIVLTGQLLALITQHVRHHSGNAG